MRCWTRDEVIAELDTIQAYDHLEYYSRERRHELIRLRHGGECARLEPSTPGLLCGKAPHLTRCAADSSALRRLNRCAVSKAPLSIDGRGINYTGGRCSMTSRF